MRRFDPWQVGWRIGQARGQQLWSPYDRTTGVFGAQGSGKTLDLLMPALLGSPGGALVTLTKLDDLLLTIAARSHGGRPVAVLDPFGLAPGLPQLVFDPIGGCVDSRVATKRAAAFVAGSVKVQVDSGDSGARFYAAQSMKALRGYFHAAALVGETIETVMRWVFNTAEASQPITILQKHPHAEPGWGDVLDRTLHGDDRTVSNTTATIDNALEVFLHSEMRARCVPSPSRPAVDIAELIERRGTIYLLGREDPAVPVAPLMTAVAEHVLETAVALATRSPHGRLCPSFTAVLDELASIAQLPRLTTSMANDRALGICYLYALQTWAQLVASYGEIGARTLLGLTNNLVVFGGGKDGAFYRELSELIGAVSRYRVTHSRGRGGSSRSVSSQDEPALRGEDIRRLPERRALVLAENADPIIAELDRCIDGAAGRRLLGNLERTRAQVNARQHEQVGLTARTDRAVAAARQMGLTGTGPAGGADR